MPRPLALEVLHLKDSFYSRLPFCNLHSSDPGMPAATASIPYLRRPVSPDCILACESYNARINRLQFGEYITSHIAKGGAVLGPSLSFARFFMPLIKSAFAVGAS
jgi:hypothetical protein